MAPCCATSRSENGGSRERFEGSRVIAQSLHITIDAVSVRPVGFDGNADKALLFYEPLGDLGALAIEFVGPV